MMLTPFARLVLSAVSDFVITSGSSLAGYMVASNGVVMPTPAMWLLASVLGAVGAARHVQAMLSDPKK